MSVSRRKVLLGTTAVAAAGASMGALSSCSATTVLPAVIDQVNKVITAACQIVPVVQTVIDVIIGFFPAAAGVATITDALAQQIAQYICALFKQAGHVDGKMPAGVMKATVGATTVTLHGYAIVDGKLAYI